MYQFYFFLKTIPIYGKQQGFYTQGYGISDSFLKDEKIFLEAGVAGPNGL